MRAARTALRPLIIDQPKENLYPNSVFKEIVPHFPEARDRQIAVGYWTVPTAFLWSGQMAVAYFLRHQPRALWPIQNGGELPLSIALPSCSSRCAAAGRQASTGFADGHAGDSHGHHVDAQFSSVAQPSSARSVRF